MKKKLSLQDFAEILAQREDIDRKAADAFARSFFDIIEQGLQTDKFVKIKGFGTFKLVAVSERESVNINTGERFQISGHTKVSFTPDSTMKELVNRPFAHFEAVDLNDETDTKEFEVIDEEMEEANEVDDDTAIDTEDDTTNESEATEDNSEVPEVSEQPSDAENNANSSSPVDATPIEIITDETSPTNADADAASQPSSPTIPTSASATLAEEVTTETAKPQNITSPQSQPLQTEAPNVSPLQPTATSQSVAEKKRTRDEEIVVTDPTPISEHADTSTTSPAPASERTNATMGYTYNEVPTPRKRNWWRITALTLLVIALMTASYFVGYYRMLCPTCDNYIFGSAPATTQPAVPTASITKPVPQPTQAAADTTSSHTDSAQVTPRQVPKTEEAPKPNATSAETNKPQQSQTTAPTTPQRPKTHCVGKGENIYRIARRYYGDDSYAEKIIKANNLKDANTIVVGMELKLP